MQLKSVTLRNTSSKTKKSVSKQPFPPLSRWFLGSLLCGRLQTRGAVKYTLGKKEAVHLLLFLRRRSLTMRRRKNDERMLAVVGACACCTDACPEQAGRRRCPSTPSPWPAAALKNAKKQHYLMFDLCAGVRASSSHETQTDVCSRPPTHFCQHGPTNAPQH